MKAFFKGIMRAKLRTALNALVIIAVAFSVCLTLSTPIGMRKTEGIPPQNNSNSSTNTTQNSTQTTSQIVNEPSSGSSDEAASTDENNDLHKTKNFSSVNLMILVGIAVVGAGLLILINIISTNKRKEEIKQINAKGVSISAIKKQFFVEVFLIVLIFGVIGTAVAAVCAKPISNAMFQNNRPDFSQMQGGAAENGDSEKPQIPTGEDGEAKAMPRGDNSETPPEKPDANINGNSNSKLDRSDMNYDRSTNYFVMCLASFGYTLGLALIAGFFCSKPIKDDKIIDEMEQKNE
ncbi:MAG: FtsX-like permease family protein [Acutalibacteraceae bacterium]